MPVKRFSKRYKTKPKYMVTYLCHDCGFDFALTELDRPKCFYCDGTRNYSEIKRKELSLETIVERMTICNNRMMENLRQAYDVRPEDNISDEDMDTIMLEAMAKGQKLGDMIRNLKKGKRSVGSEGGLVRKGKTGKVRKVRKAGKDVTRGG